LDTKTAKDAKLTKARRPLVVLVLFVVFVSSRRRLRR